MTLNQLRYFQAVARLQNFRAAAEELYISQPSLSRSIDSLEDELGVVLFEKSGRGIALTGSGRLLLEYANRIIEECDIAIYKMKELSTSGGRIDIGYVFPLANYYIPHKVRSFLDMPGNEHVTFGFTQNRTSSIIRDIKNKVFIYSSIQLGQEGRLVRHAERMGDGTAVARKEGVHFI